MLVHGMEELFCSCVFSLTLPLPLPLPLSFLFLLFPLFLFLSRLVGLQWQWQWMADDALDSQALKLRASASASGHADVCEVQDLWYDWWKSQSQGWVGDNCQLYSRTP